jgi:outer membrane receptor protein involved in Fe transport
VFFYGRQQLSSNVSLFIEGLFASRRSVSTQTYPPSFTNTTGVRQYVGTGGFEFELPHGWSGSAFSSVGDQRSRQDTLQFNDPAAEPSHFALFVVSGKTRSAEINANGPVLDWYAGTLRLALGAGHRFESFDYAGNLHRDVDYVFGELAVPLWEESGSINRRLELNVSGRYERYSDAGNKAVPRLGLMFSPWAQLRTRVSWSKSFRAPTLNDLYDPRTLALLEGVPDPQSATGSSIVMSPGGGNADLGPEAATSWTIGLDYEPTRIDALRLSMTCFNIEYTDRIGRISNFYAGLIDPENISFVTRSPAEPLQRALIEEAGANFYNGTSAPYDPATVAAIIDFRNRNIARQSIRGVDAQLSYDVPLDGVDIEAFLEAAYLDIAQRLTPAAMEQGITGTAFNPPTVKVSAGGTAAWGPLTFTGTINYIDDAVNTSAPENPRVASWTTVNAQLAYQPRAPGSLHGARLSLSAQNLFNKGPPYLTFDTFRSGIHYDSLNATPLGRFVSLQLSKEW